MWERVPLHILIFVVHGMEVVVNGAQVHFNYFLVQKVAITAAGVCAHSSSWFIFYHHGNRSFVER